MVKKGEFKDIMQGSNYVNCPVEVETQAGLSYKGQISSVNLMGQSLTLKNAWCSQERVKYGLITFRAFDVLNLQILP